MEKVLGVFSKGIPDSRTHNYSRSATSNCDKGCRQLREKKCYAERIEKVYTTLGDRLLRHERIPPENLNYLAIAELNTIKRLDWFRFSAFGSVPKSKDYRRKAFRASMDKLFTALVKKIGRADRIHLPVESHAKAKAYREMADPHGICVRESLQSTSRLKDLRGPASIVVGTADQTPAERHKQVLKMATELRSKGLSCVGCPAVLRDSKCGQCTACADKRVDLVIYPLH